MCKGTRVNEYLLNALPKYKFSETINTSTQHGIRITYREDFSLNLKI